jgi:hypothetical protein
MRGLDGTQESLVTLAKRDAFVPADHPLRAIRELVNEALEDADPLGDLVRRLPKKPSCAKPSTAAAMTVRRRSSLFVLLPAAGMGISSRKSRRGHRMARHGV